MQILSLILLISHKPHVWNYLTANPNSEISAMYCEIPLETGNLSVNLGIYSKFAYYTSDDAQTMMLDFLQVRERCSSPTRRNVRPRRFVFSPSRLRYHPQQVPRHVRQHDFRLLHLQRHRVRRQERHLSFRRGLRSRGRPLRLSYGLLC